MNTVQITTTENRVRVRSAYNQHFVDAARNLGGRWEAPNWTFDIREEAAVRQACMEAYGTDGNVSDTVDVRVTFVNIYGMYGDRAPLMLFGRNVARAFSRDSGARIGEGVVVESGGFTSGGSAKNWETRVQEGTVIVLRDVSRALVNQWDDERVTVEVLEDARAVDTKALEAERERLVARLAEIDELLNPVVAMPAGESVVSKKALRVLD